MKKKLFIFLLFIGAISINSCSDTNNSPSGTFTVNLIDGSTNQPIPNIQGASWAPLFRHDNALETYNNGSNVQLNGGKLKINMAESHGKIWVIHLYGPLSSDLDPNSAFSQKYYTQGDPYFLPSAGLEQTFVYYTKAKIKCIVNVTKPENVGKRFYIRLMLPNNQKMVLNNNDGDGYLILSLKLGQQIIYINAIGKYKNQLEWNINESLPNIPIEIFCNESETKDLIINL
ncbi:hypothetical protein [Flavobacterium sp.]|jgi:hypothetical protein|uniref:hypothetical protein n=1 Tax=Flavobacterium sp. TaxID=239 RepID=UPI0037C075CA